MSQESGRISITDHNGGTLDYSPDEFWDAYHRLPLWERARYAASVVEEVNEKLGLGLGVPHDRSTLYTHSRRWQDEAAREEIANADAAAHALLERFDVTPKRPGSGHNNGDNQ